MTAIDQSGKLRDLRVVTFESRRSKEITEMIARHGGRLISAPALREVPLSQNAPAVEFARRLGKGEIDVVILLTGVGTRFLAAAIAEVMPKESLALALSSIITVARGPKPIAALRELDVTPTVSVPEPNTWRELLAAVDARLQTQGRRVAVQEYGEENPDLLAGLTERGASVLRVPVYKWALPVDLRPLREAIAQILAAQVHIAVFTTATQVEHLFQVAGTKQAASLQAGFERIVVASIGPFCSDALRRHGIKVDLEPEHPKMGHLISTLAERGPALVQTKRRSQQRE